MNKRNFRVQMGERFSLSEIKTMMFDFDIDSDDFIGGKSKVIQALYEHMVEGNRLSELIQYCERERGFVSWR